MYSHRNPESAELQPGLFDIPTPEQELHDPKLSIEELVTKVAAIRTRQWLRQVQTGGELEPLEPVGTDEPIPELARVGEKKKRWQNQGAFGGALKRRIGETDSAEKLAATTKQDIDLLNPETLRYELFSVDGDQQFGGVLFTPDELGNLAFSASSLAKRLGSRVVRASKAKGRTPTEQHARRAEVVQGTLTAQHDKAVEEIERKTVDLQITRRLRREMRSPGYAHMTGEDMDRHMRHVEGIVRQMFEAITVNHDAGTEQVDSLVAALDCRLSDDNYKQTFRYWEDLGGLSLAWTFRKLAVLQRVRGSIEKEIAERMQDNVPTTS